MLSTKNITSLRPKVKWSNKFMGPYTVVGQAGANAYKLDLPNSLKIHPVFHTSLLLPYRESKIDNREQPPPPPVIIDNNVEWEVDKIIDSRMYYGHLQYLVKWRGYDNIASEWLWAEDLDHCTDIIDEFKSTHTEPQVQKPKRARRN